MIGAAQSQFERLPVNEKTETNQRMAHVDQLLQIYLKQLLLWLLRLTLGLHRFSPVSNAFAITSGKFKCNKRRISSGFIGVLLAFQDRLTTLESGGQRRD